jgi:hypothetical protein
MATLVYAILLIGILFLPIPFLSLLEYRNRKSQQRRGFALLQAAAARRQLVLSSPGSGANGWLAVDHQQRMLVLVTVDADEWDTRYLEILPGATCHIARRYPQGDATAACPLSIALCIKIPGEMPAEWNLYHSTKYQPRKHQQAEQLAEQWCSVIQKMSNPLQNQLLR